VATSFIRAIALGAAIVLVPALPSFADDDRLHVCSITINSSDEIDTFRKHLPESAFDFVELTDYARESSEDPKESWFGRACKSGVQCDVVVLSGHFANEYLGSFGTTFAGDTGVSLSLAELEQRSCDQSCGGILARPTEAFLFGCRTLAKSLPERPLPKTDLDLLAKYGISPENAALVLDELRFHGDDTSNRERMRFVFSGVPHLYGFEETAPVGPDARPGLEKYFRTKGDYAKYLRGEAAAREKKPAANRELARAIAPSTFTQCSGLDRADPAYARATEMCSLRNESTSTTARLGRLEAAFDQPGFVSYLPAIAAFLRSHPPASFGAEENAVLARIRANDAARQSATDLVQNLKTPLLRLEILRMARDVGWLDQDESLPIFRQIVLQFLSPPTYGEGRDAICGIDEATRKRFDLKAEEIPDGVYKNEFGIQALGCLKPADERIHVRLAKSLSDPREWISRLAAKSLGEMKPPGVDVQEALADQLLRPEEGARLGAAEALRELKPSDPRVLKAIRRNDPTFAIDWTSARGS